MGVGTISLHRVESIKVTEPTKITVSESWHSSIVVRFADGNVVTIDCFADDGYKLIADAYRVDDIPADMTQERYENGL